MVHPLIKTLHTAGPLAQTTAANLRLDRYGAFDLARNMSILADALVCDATGHWMINDRTTVDDRDMPKAERAAAASRTVERTQISSMLTDLPYDWRKAVIDALHAGRGAVIADALQDAAEAGMSSLTAALNDMAIPAFEPVTA